MNPPIDSISLLVASGVVALSVLVGSIIIRCTRPAAEPPKQKKTIIKHVHLDLGCNEAAAWEDASKDDSHLWLITTTEDGRKCWSSREFQCNLRKDIENDGYCVFVIDGKPNSVARPTMTNIRVSEIPEEGPETYLINGPYAAAMLRKYYSIREAIRRSSLSVRKISWPNLVPAPKDESEPDSESD